MCPNCVEKLLFYVNAISRISKYLDTKSLLKLFYAFVRSNFQYSNVVWHFTDNVSIMKMEKLHRRAIRIVLNDYNSSYKDLLSKAKIDSLYISRIKSIAIEAFKCHNKINPTFLHDLIVAKESGYDFRDPYKAEIPEVSTSSYGLSSFSFEAPKIWNSLPVDIKSSSTLEIFISKINQWTGPICMCQNCVLCQINAM